MATESIYKKHQPANSNGLYLKLKDGDKVRLRIISDPAVSTYDGNKLRYNWVVVNRDAGTAHVYQSGSSVFNQISELVDDWGDPREFDITIKRTGSGQTDTKYTVNAVPPKMTTEPSEEDLSKADSIDLIKACEGKWLADFEEDGVMPDSLGDKKDEAFASEGIEGEPFSEEDLPPELK